MTTRRPKPQASMARRKRLLLESFHDTTVSLGTANALQDPSVLQPSIAPPRGEQLDLFTPTDEILQDWRKTYEHP